MAQIMKDGSLALEELLPKSSLIKFCPSQPIFLLSGFSFCWSRQLLRKKRDTFSSYTPPSQDNGITPALLEAAPQLAGIVTAVVEAN